MHALSHPLGGLKGLALHHGTLNAVLLPTVLRFNADAGAEKYATIRRTLDLAAGADLAEVVADLARRIGVPGTLSAMGVPRDALDRVAAQAPLDHSAATNPRPASEQDYRVMLEAAFA